MTGSEMQQLTVATAGFEHAWAGTAEAHLIKEKAHLAALSQAKLPSPFPGREGASSEQGMRRHACARGCEAALPVAGDLSALQITSVPPLRPGLSVTACSLLGWEE